VLYIGSLSKVGASGLRIGWLAAPQSIINRLTDARQQMDFGLSIVPQWVAANLLESDELRPHLERLRSSLRRRRDVLTEALRRELPEELSFEIPRGGLNLWCRIRRPIQDNALLENGFKQGVLFVPGTVFGSDAGYVRFTYARPPMEEIEPGVERFAAALRATRTVT
jgi:DNA-binding transcriptional MocR family regulator